jgi:hypothetical protein
MTDIEEYIKEKIYKYCDDKVMSEQEFTAWDVSNDNEELFWIVSVLYYSMWLGENSDGFESVELSQQEW